MSMQDTLISNMRTLVHAYGGHLGSTTVRVIRSVGLDKGFAAVIDRGESFNITSYDRLVQAFSDAWPENMKWPDGIDRPEPRSDERSKVA